MFKTFLTWLLKSSADPKKLSLTLKGIIPFLVILIGWFGIGQDIVEPLLSQTADAIVNVIVALLTALTAFQTLYGFVRKIWLTLKKKAENSQ